MSSNAPQLATASPLGSAPLPPDWTDQLADRHPGDGRLAAEITTRIVSLLRRHTGRGPTRAKTGMSADLVVVTLAECLTSAEKRLVDCGHAELVNRARDTIHQCMRAEAAAIVEDCTSRHVVAYLTDQEHDPDLTVFVFYLAAPT